MNLPEASLAFFLTSGSSLKIWDRIGVFDREIAPYNALASRFRHMYIFSYGGREELGYRSKFAENVTILHKARWFPGVLYQLFIPVLYRKILSQCQIYKTNQIYGSFPAILSKFLYHGKLVVRSGYIASLNAKLYRRPRLRRWYTNCLEYLAYRCCDLAFIPTAENARHLAQRYGFLKKKLQVVNNAIDSDLFRPLALEKIYDLGYVGRLEKDKNLLNLLRGITDSHLSVCFIGQGSEKSTLLDFAKEQGIRLTHIDRVSNHQLPEYYNRFTLFVFPSLHEGNPKSLLEAMACGLPVIGCDVVGVRNIIQDQVNGILATTEPAGLRSAIRLVYQNQTLKQRLGSSARDTILKAFDSKTLLQQELGLLSSIINIPNQ